MLFLERIIQEIVLCAVYNECRLNDELSFQEGKNMIRKYVFGEPIETGAVDGASGMRAGDYGDGSGSER